MTNPKVTKDDANEAFFNLGKLAGKLSTDDGKRLYMLTQIVASYMAHLEEARKPLDKDEIMKVIDGYVDIDIIPLVEFARSIEERHGIK
jgi:hypothetical protein